MKKSFKELLLEGIREINISLTRDDAGLFETYMSELERWNKRINITSICGELDIIVKHFIDSLSPLKYISPNSSVLDIGSGGGFPGIPLKIADPTLQTTLLESTLKKVNFQKHIIRMLNLEDITAVHGRAGEKIQQKGEDLQFDVVISRAFSDMGSFLKIAEPYVKRQGRIIAMRGRDAKKEMNDIEKAIKNLELEVEDVHEFYLPYLKEKRSIVIFRGKAVAL